jgi:hypothetical protein
LAAALSTRHPGEARCCPLAPEVWLCNWHRGRGPPPFRFAPIRGPPSSTNTSQMFMARPVAEWWTGASGQQQVESRAATTRELIGTLITRWGVRRRTAWGEDGRESRREIGEKAASLIGRPGVRHGGVRPPGRQTKRLQPHRGMSWRHFLHGSWVARVGDPLRGGSVAPVRRRRARSRSP